MKKQQIIIIVLALIGTLIIAGSTVALLSYLDDKKSSESIQLNENIQEETLVEDTLGEPINQEVNAKAEIIEQDAARLMESSPQEARAKYLEAETMYQEAGNLQKLGEMRANAMTAEILIQQKSN